MKNSNKVTEILDECLWFSLHRLFNEKLRQDMMTFSCLWRTDVRSCFSLCVNRDQLTYWFISFWCFKYMCYLQKNTDTEKYLFIHSYLPETTPKHECCSILFGSARMTDCTIHQYSDLAKAYHIVSSFKALEVS